jgi:hypothetical protein
VRHLEEAVRSSWSAIDAGSTRLMSADRRGADRVPFGLADPVALQRRAPGGLELGPALVAGFVR